MSLATKKSLRQHYRHVRRQVSLEQKISSAHAIAKLFLENFSPHQKKIAVYLACDGEIDLQCLIKKLWEMNCSVFLPVISSDKQKLYFVQYIQSSIMKKNQYNTDEPENIDESISPEELDIVLMPLVAFDYHGVRLGMGKGYYDKSFSFCSSSHKPELIGIAYQFQYCENLLKEDWDVLLDGILTEEKFTLISESI